MKKMVYFYVLGFLAFASISFAEIFAIKDYYATIGNRSEFIKQVQTDVSGQKNGLMNWDIIAGLGFEMGLSTDFSLFIDTGVNFPRSGPDGMINRWKLWTHSLIGFNTWDFVIKLGTGFEFLRLSGPGGTQPLNNGTGSDNFYLPEGATYSTNLVAISELEYYFSEEISSRISLLLYNPMGDFDRSYTWKMGIAYHFGADIF